VMDAVSRENDYLPIAALAKFVFVHKKKAIPHVLIVTIARVIKLLHHQHKKHSQNYAKSFQKNKAVALDNF